METFEGANLGLKLKEMFEPLFGPPTLLSSSIFIEQPRFWATSQYPSNQFWMSFDGVYVPSFQFEDKTVSIYYESKKPEVISYSDPDFNLEDLFWFILFLDDVEELEKEQAEQFERMEAALERIYQKLSTKDISKGLEYGEVVGILLETEKALGK